MKGISEYFDEMWVRTSDIRTDEFKNLKGAPQEKEANDFARDTLIAPKEWEKVASTLLRTSRETPLLSFANQQSISPAIVAGRIRWEKRNYTLFSQLMGNKQVRSQFPE